jgi:hypothetical protein
MSGSEEITELLRLFTSVRRRKIIFQLQQRDEGETVDVRTIAEEVAAREQDLDVECVSSQDYQSVYTGMIQNHLIRLEDQGMIGYDRDRKRITVTKRTLNLARAMKYAVEAVIKVT